MTLLIVGVGHVFRIEAAIRNLILAERPNVVALELDPGRFQGLLRRNGGQAGVPVPATAPRAYRLLAKFQEDVASSLGTQVGNEMVAGVEAAQTAGSQLALIDRSAEESVRRLWSQMSLKERLRLFGSLLWAKISWGKGRGVEEEIARYQKDPASYLKEVQRQFPTVTRVLIDERNQHMAQRLRDLTAGDRNVVALVGDGHVEGLLALLQDLGPRTVRLSELRRTAATMGIQWRTSPSGDRVTFSFDQKSLEGTLRRGP